MPIYIRSKSLGRFIGTFIGLGFFESHIRDGDCSPDEKPIEFPTTKEAQDFLGSWEGGASDCEVVDEP